MIIAVIAVVLFLVCASCLSLSLCICMPVCICINSRRKKRRQSIELGESMLYLSVCHCLYYPNRNKTTC